MSSTAPLTDSPWFWVMVFSGMGMIALEAMALKFGPRQAQIERQYQARQLSPTPPGARPAVRYSSPQDTLITIRPLRWIAIAVFAGSLVMLVRSRMRSDMDQRPET